MWLLSSCSQLFLCIDKEWKEITSFVSLQVLNHTIYLTRKAK